MLLVALIVVVAPHHLLAWDTADARVPDRAKAINDIRTTLLQGLAGVALLVGAFFTWRQLQVTRYGQLSERFTAAVEQLGSPSVEVRIGAVFALERVAVDSRDDRGTVAEVLCLFAQRNALATPLEARPAPGEIARSGEVALAHAGDTLLVLRSPDVHAAVTVLGRAPRPEGLTLRLQRADLRRSMLDHADLVDADLHYADLTNVHLQGARLQRVDLSGTWLVRAILLGADLRQASMRSVLLCHARLDDADLRAADLSNADLTAAVIGAARFELADLRGAVLTGTDLTGATFTKAVADATTVWPQGFDAAAAGVLCADNAPPLQPLSFFPQDPA
ncbi:pentapeptide repeat-containing protein [Streptomyces sp. NBC_01283]|uniref:pentapeptide repeat-containing protein n=1 Tax=Streptomyces sp. NBC_01283 TaxID=2903812 RepID=UPI00352BF827|nr:pentapeptide repeat-containing protein [Streptomyces sp. NBC_01283]